MAHPPALTRVLLLRITAADQFHHALIETVRYAPDLSPELPLEALPPVQGAIMAIATSGATTGQFHEIGAHREAEVEGEMIVALEAEATHGVRAENRQLEGIVVEKLTKNVNEQHLHEIFGKFGQIQSLELPMNPQFMTNRGTAYILYYDPVDAEAAISHMHEAQLDGAVLNVSIVLPRRTFSRSPPPRSRPDFRRFDAPPFGGGHSRSSAMDSRRYRSPPPRHRSPRRYPGPRGMERHDIYRPRSRTRSRSPRGRSPSYSSRSPSRTPPPRRRHDRDSPRAWRRNSSHSSHSDRNRSRSRSRSRNHSRSRYSPERR
ncbi:hypothetical protein AJ80_09389 [Polytolypa hystricis UAMH7299]|uniref:RRM domain-containing protein n=1 Tax=Polytolypa hystricis (strain UAMH7299) TaxID=1447883 RepID=A0A2B7WRT8_POLH7|nr:hypothetical protein AJ80_09389 [Polytolypa hystricis UAMH7299]